MILKKVKSKRLLRPLLNHLIGEGNGTPLQYTCLENPMDRGAWWAAVHGVTRSRTWLSDFTFSFHFLFSPSCIGEGNGNPLKCSCLENPRDGGAWWAAVSGVTQSRTRLKWLSINHLIELNILSEISQVQGFKWNSYLTGKNCFKYWRKNLKINVT